MRWIVMAMLGNVGNVSALTPGRRLKWCSRHLLAE